MQRTPVLPLDGTGLEALDLDAGAPRGGVTADPAAEPDGYLVAMDGGVRIHFLDWSRSAPRAGTARTGVAPGDAGVSDGGSVPGILLIHGLARTAWSWASVARLLHADARVAAMDLRGHGLSDAPTHGYDRDQLAEDAIAVAEGAGLLAVGADPRAAGSRGERRFAVVGHGYGAIVAAWTARALGDRCSGLVLVDGGWTDVAAETELTPDEWLAAIAEPPEVLASMAAWLADRAAFDPASWGPDAERAARAEVVETAAGRVKLAIHGHALAASVGAMWTFEPGAVLATVQAGIVALAARDDDARRHLAALRAVAALRARAGRPAIRAAGLPGLGHDLPRHAPGAVAAAIRAAARGTPDMDRGTRASASG